MASQNGVYCTVMGTRRGKCEADGCTGCPVFQLAEATADDHEGDGGPCIRCGHFPHQHEGLGSDSANDTELLSRMDPLGLLAEDGANTEKELESRKKLQGMCEWSIEGHELRFLDRLGSGKTAKVYKGLYRGEEVAIKVLKPVIEEKQISNFKKELDVMSAIISPHVVKFYGGCLLPKVCLVMEYCSNGSLFHLLQRKDFDLTWPTLFRLLNEVVCGVRDLHCMEVPIVHRDLKSLNLLVDKNLAVKVCDFGLSRFTAGSENMETLQKLRGTYAYSAPEVYFGEKYSTKSDVFSLGVIIWETIARCITGDYHRPYKEFAKIKIDYQIIIHSAKHGLRPTIPEACPTCFAELIRKCWDADPEVRPECIDVLDTLTKIEDEYRTNERDWESRRTPAVRIEQTESFQKKTIDDVIAKMSAAAATPATPAPTEDTAKEDKRGGLFRSGTTSKKKGKSEDTAKAPEISAPQWKRFGDEEDEDKRSKTTKDRGKKGKGVLGLFKGSKKSETSLTEPSAQAVQAGTETRAQALRVNGDQAFLRVYLENGSYTTIAVNSAAKTPNVRYRASEKLHVEDWRGHGLFYITKGEEKKFKRTEKPVAVTLKVKEDALLRFLLRPWGSSRTSDDLIDDDFAEEDFD